MAGLSSTQRPGVWVMLSGFSRPFYIRLAIAGVFVLSSLWLVSGGFTRSFSSPTRLVLADEVLWQNPLKLQSIPLTHKNVVVASCFDWHYDVYMAVAWTLERLKLKDHGKLQVYAPTVFPYKFKEVVDQHRLYEGKIEDYHDLIGDIKRNGNSDGGVDLVIMGTCELDLILWSEELLAIWDARDAAHKFQIVCIVHNALDIRWQSNIPEWSRRNAIRLLPISEHVAIRFRQIFKATARSSDIRLNSAGYEHIPVDVHMPILNIQSPALPPNRVLSNVVIQGSYATDRRDYAGIFSQLNASLHVEPELWGYSRLQEGEDSTFVPLPNTALNDSSPFKLHLVGNGWMTVPPELKNIVVFHSSLAYPEYYKLMSGMDICLPAFPPDSDAYYVHQASSTVLMCMENNVPILGVHELRQAYTDLDDDKITITRPAVMSEVQAIRALRSGDASTFLAGDPTNSGIRLGDHRGIREAVEEMMRKGWMKTKEGFDECKQKTWDRNEIVMMRILRDL